MLHINSGGEYMARISLEIEGLEDKITKLNHSATRIHNILSQFNTEKKHY